MGNAARTQHRRLDQAYAESEARDGGADGQPDIARPTRWRQDNVSGGRQQPKVLLMQLSERTSASGRKYYSGWLGKASVVAFEAREPDKFGRPAWDVYISEPRPKVGGDAGGSTDGR